jgi:dolichol-phosphate mannosyltransferase
MALQVNRFTLVIPTLNEAGNIATLLDRATAALAKVKVPWDILVVDDESSDGTSGIVEDYHKSESRVRLMSRTRRRGLAGAITFGWTQTDADIIGVMDADLQHPPELLPLLLDEISKGCDLAIASRYLSSGSTENWNRGRQFLSYLAILASRPVQRQTSKVKDPMSGFFVLRRACIAELEFQPTGFKLLLEILAKGRIKSVAEVPFKFASRHSGASKANVMTGFQYFALLYKLSRYLISGPRKHS